MPPVRDRSKTGARCGSTSPPWWYTTEMQSTRKMAEQHAQDVKRIDSSLCGIQRRISESTQSLAQRVEALETDRAAADGASWAASAGGSRFEAQVRRLDAMAMSMTDLESSFEALRSRTAAQIATFMGAIEELQRQSGAEALLPTDDLQACMKYASVDCAEKEVLAKLTEAMFETGKNAAKQSKEEPPPTGSDASTEQMEDLVGSAIQKCVRELLPQLKTYAASNCKLQLGRRSNNSSTLECPDGAADRLSSLKPEGELGVRGSSRAATEQRGGTADAGVRRGEAATPSTRQEGCVVEESSQGNLAGGMQKHAVLEVCSRVEASVERFRSAQHASPQAWNAAALSPASPASNGAVRQLLLKAEPYWKAESTIAPPVGAAGAHAPDTEFCQLLADRLASRQEMVPSPTARSLRFQTETPSSNRAAALVNRAAAPVSGPPFLDVESSQGSLAGGTQKHAALVEVCSRVEASVERFRNAQQASPATRSAAALSPSSPSSSSTARQPLPKPEPFAETPSDSENEAVAAADRGRHRRHTFPPSQPGGRDPVAPWHSRRSSEHHGLPPNWQPLESVKTPRLNRDP